MTKRMILETVTVFTIAAVALTAFAPAASAQSGTLKFKIPFDFYAGGTLMPAGEYSISTDNVAKATQIYDRAGHVTTVLHTASIGRAIDNHRMVFNRYGTMTFLSEVQWATSDTGFRLRESKLERETRLVTPPVRVAVQPKQ
jgi:hypothetical protein